MSDGETWAERPDGISCCGGDHGAVASDEVVARLLHSRIIEPDSDPVPRRELFPPPKGFTNKCGDADGMSVTRRDTLSDDDLRARATVQAERKEGRTQQGALLATVAMIRAIRLDGEGDRQVAFVYDDPTEHEPLHAVVRGCDQLGRPDQDELRGRMRGLFDRQVPPSPPAS